MNHVRTMARNSFFVQLQNNLVTQAMCNNRALNYFKFSNHKYSDINDVQWTSSIRLVQSQSCYVLTAHEASCSTDSSVTY